MKKIIHLRQLVGRYRLQHCNGRLSDNWGTSPAVEEVTCKACLKKIAKYGLPGEAAPVENRPQGV